MSQYRLSHHAEQQAKAKGISPEAVLRAANHPTITYDNRRHPGQRRHIHGDVCAAVDPASGIVVTFYRNVVETALRADQTDRDAIRYGRRVKQNH